MGERFLLLSWIPCSLFPLASSCRLLPLLPPSETLWVSAVPQSQHLVPGQLSDLQKLLESFPPKYASLCSWASLLFTPFPPVSASLAPVSISTTIKLRLLSLSQVLIYPCFIRLSVAICSVSSLLKELHTQVPSKLLAFIYKVWLARQQQLKIMLQDVLEKWKR